MTLRTRQRHLRHQPTRRHRRTRQLKITDPTLPVIRLIPEQDTLRRTPRVRADPPRRPAGPRIRIRPGTQLEVVVHPRPRIVIRIITRQRQRRGQRVHRRAVHRRRSRQHRRHIRHDQSLRKILYQLIREPGNPPVHHVPADRVRPRRQRIHRRQQISRLPRIDRRRQLRRIPLMHQLGRVRRVIHVIRQHVGAVRRPHIPTGIRQPNLDLALLIVRQLLIPHRATRRIGIRRPVRRPQNRHLRPVRRRRIVVRQELLPRIIVGRTHPHRRPRVRLPTMRPVIHQRPQPVVAERPPVSRTRRRIPVGETTLRHLRADRRPRPQHRRAIPRLVHLIQAHRPRRTRPRPAVHQRHLHIQDVGLVHRRRTLPVDIAVVHITATVVRPDMNIVQRVVMRIRIRRRHIGVIRIRLQHLHRRIHRHREHPRRIRQPPRVQIHLQRQPAIHPAHQRVDDTF